ncbi:Glycogen phosphorylase 1 [Nymphaea thermarum]|nr:Glycogen phosphorylase 1 [Nymphaea thermarum]
MASAPPLHSRHLPLLLPTPFPSSLVAIVSLPAHHRSPASTPPLISCRTCRSLAAARHLPRSSAQSDRALSAESVVVDNDSSPAYTALVVATANRIGLLQVITRVFAVFGLKIEKASVEEIQGDFVVKRFCVTDGVGKKIEDPKNLDRIVKALREALEKEPARVAGPSASSGSTTRRPPQILKSNLDGAKVPRAELMFGMMDRYLKNDPISIQKDILNHVEYTIARSRFSFNDFEAYQALAHSVRDRLIERWHDTQQYFKRNDPKRVYFLSLEFLMGRSLSNSLTNLGIRDQYAEAVSQLGFDFEVLVEKEGDAALGNGGLARLSACLMDSLATLDLPAWGYGLRYQYGLFRQQILDGYQHEQPDFWLNFGNPWEIERIHISYPVKYYGKVEEQLLNGRKSKVWVPEETVEAVAYDNPIPGYGTKNTINLRLWAAKPSGQYDMESFNTGDYINSIINGQKAETISNVLYPDDRTYQGKELRLKQQYFFVSASLQDIVRRFKDSHTDFDAFPDKVALQLNDTHPSLSVVELMRILVDEEHLDWKRAWKIVCKVFSITIHTVVAEGLEKVPVDLMGSLLPRHLEIIHEINFYFLEDLKQRYGSDFDRLSRMSIVEEGAAMNVRMANLAIVCCNTVNAVSQVHSKLLKGGALKDFHQLWPQKIQYKTNGVTQRRWIVVSNPGLCNLITKSLGTDTWISNIDLLMGLRQHAEDTNLQNEWKMVRKLNKIRLAEYIETITGLKVSVDAMFDVQAKRIHEYKRQLLNVLGIIYRYDCIKNMKADDKRKVVPRVCIIGGKAAPGYEMAKNIIKLIHAVAEKINNDDDIGDLLKLVFIPDYNVSVAEVVIPGSDLSQHIRAVKFRRYCSSLTRYCSSLTGHCSSLFTPDNLLKPASPPASARCLYLSVWLRRFYPAPPEVPVILPSAA